MQKQSCTFSYEESYKNIESIRIIKSAIKGLIMLQQTYEQNVKDFANGVLSINNDKIYNFRSTDSLNPQDLALMSKIAFSDFNWYDSSVEYLRIALNMYLEAKKRGQVRYGKKVEKHLFSMKARYPAYHNEVFGIMDNPIGPDWKLYPCLVDQGNFIAAINLF